MAGRDIEGARGTRADSGQRECGDVLQVGRPRGHPALRGHRREPAAADEVIAGSVGRDRIRETDVAAADAVDEGPRERPGGGMRAQAA